MKSNKDCREYIILAYKKKTLEFLKKQGYNLSPIYMMRVKEYSKLGKIIKREALKQSYEQEIKNEKQ